MVSLFTALLLEVNSIVKDYYLFYSIKKCHEYWRDRREYDYVVFLLLILKALAKCVNNMPHKNVSRAHTHTHSHVYKYAFYLFLKKQTTQFLMNVSTINIYVAWSVFLNVKQREKLSLCAIDKINTCEGSMEHNYTFLAHIYFNRTHI